MKLQQAKITEKQWGVRKVSEIMKMYLYFSKFIESYT